MPLFAFNPDGVSGTGAGGLVSTADVFAALTRRTGAAAAAAAAAGQPNAVNPAPLPEQLGQGQAQTPTTGGATVPVWNADP
jgi:pyruvate/2-oxoglutarate dehydrogenase complex dihydrolipoamide acyltransferase (E2) component